MMEMLTMILWSRTEAWQIRVTYLVLLGEHRLKRSLLSQKTSIKLLLIIALEYVYKKPSLTYLNDYRYLKSYLGEHFVTLFYE